jgi:NitT/TauT family transport system substrate-binding protein
MKSRRSQLFLKVLSISMCVVFVISLMGCAKKTDVKPTESNKSSEAVKTMPDKLSVVNLGLSSRKLANYIPIYIAIKKGYFQKYNLDVKLTYVQGGVLALRGLQTGNFQIISSLPESVITGVAEGANVKLIGTLDDQSIFSVYVAKDIHDLKDLKGKTAAGNVPGNGTTMQIEYWLKKQGLEPNKDVRIINDGDAVERLQALQQGQAAVTILTQPTILKADELGFKSYPMRDVLKTYNGNIFAANGETINKNPEYIYAFMSAMADAIAFSKDKANRDEVIKIAMEDLEVTKSDAEKSFDFVLPILADKAKMKIDGVKWALDTLKETGVLKTDMPMDKLVDERFYAK